MSVVISLSWVYLVMLWALRNSWCPLFCFVFYLPQPFSSYTLSWKHQLTTPQPQFPSPLSFPSTFHPLNAALPFLSSSPWLHHPPPPPPFHAESTGGSSRYMYSRLLRGHHDNRHEFDMAITYPGGCESLCGCSSNEEEVNPHRRGRIVYLNVFLFFFFVFF